MVSTDQSLGMQTKQTQVFNQYKKEQPPPVQVRGILFFLLYWLIIGKIQQNSLDSKKKSQCELSAKKQQRLSVLSAWSWSWISQLMEELKDSITC